MPEITMPEVKLPDVKLPEGLREMKKDDIVEAVREVKLPNDTKLRDVKLPRSIKLPDVDLSDVELPDAIANRLPRRRRTNPLIIPLLALTVVGLMVVAARWLMTSSTTGPRVRRAVDDLKSRMNGESNDLIRYDDETDLGSLIGSQEGLSTPTPSDPYGLAPSSFSDESVAVGPGMTAEPQAELTR